MLIPEKLHFRLISRIFWFKNLRKRFCLKKSFESILRVYATVTLCKKIRKILRINFSKNLKSLLLGTFWSVLAQNQNKAFPKKLFMSTLRLKVALTLWKKLEKFSALTFDNTWKTLFGAFFCPKSSIQDFSLKKIV